MVTFVALELPQMVWRKKKETYTDRGIFIQLVFGSNAKACAVVASSPCQVDCSLQLVTGLLVDGATKFCSIIAVMIENKHFQIKM